MNIDADKKGDALLLALSEYISKCSEENSRKEKKEKGILPNVCGYCSYMNIGKEELCSLLSDDGVTADRISTVLEDALINSESSAGSFTHCMKMIQRLRGEDGGAEEREGNITVIFAHPDGEEE